MKPLEMIDRPALELFKILHALLVLGCSGKCIEKTEKEGDIQVLVHHISSEEYHLFANSYT